MRINSIIIYTPELTSKGTKNYPMEMTQEGGNNETIWKQALQIALLLHGKLLSECNKWIIKLVIYLV